MITLYWHINGDYFPLYRVNHESEMIEYLESESKNIPATGIVFYSVNH